jgi:cell wall assembly regulator SMI1
MTFWQVEPTDPKLLETVSARNAISGAFDISSSHARQQLRRLALGWRACVRADHCDLKAVEGLGLVITRTDAPLATVVAETAASERFARVWSRFRAELEPVAPEALAGLNPPALEEHRRAVEVAVGTELPEDYVAWLALHDGSHTSSGPFGWQVDDLASVIDSKKINDDLTSIDGQHAADADVGIEPRWWHRQWVPFASNGAGDLLCIDLAPTAGGKPGQVLEFLHDSRRRRLVAPSFLEWVARAAADFFEGRFVATEDRTGFFGMLERKSLVGSLASLRVRGEPEDARAERVERELLGNPMQLALQVLPRLRNRSLLVLGPDAMLGLTGIELKNDLVAAIAGKNPGERALAIHRVLDAHPAVTSYVASVDDVAQVIRESGE